MSTTLTLDLPDEAATRALGARLARLARPGDVILLFGTLGTGKSTLARAFIRALTSPDEEVPSPTFTLVQAYEAKTADIWHFDLYRLDKPEDAYELGIEDAFLDGVSLIEWPERLGGLAPRRRLDLSLETGGAETARRATLTSHGQWDDRLKDLPA
ncbi:tRNA (adenosine(37)-N6)-threonylcarbamoyltransferase complex ATPase subunit type 1 TsaE [Magnetospirillum aberrantis]|uniref:tRNA threonylcarbamoyladenosine biosynthesis protein TsaE n=1 Tax=Magnetospirillum aberrantis SpK TaxID=908842 RepID=A0A7C9QRP7_9PROT|nr:tRNA (adenosine(37)-N6)-threonylcarbamoyltransferase complex ATPase subunit type 1 TsaE [Magnetospirillum aberrantis]NFV78637.1 tRNA (adenosine(37)-N6)-threonylcarbamoyltransferase complex ATPase subunit type 1 TsaE [Magnetospirillum aberrantis SpK]